MTIETFRLVLSAALVTAFVVQSVAIVAGAYLLWSYGRRFLRKFQLYLDLVAKHAALTTEQATQLTESINATTRAVPRQTAQAVLETLAAAGVPLPPPAPPMKGPPPLPGTPALPAERHLDPPTPPPVRGKTDPRDHGGGGSGVRSASYFALFLVGLGTLWAADVQEFAVSVESGKAALRKGDACKAEVMFARAGDELGIAEALILQRRYDEAAMILERHPSDGKAVLFSALIARGRGDVGGGKALLAEAASLGNLEARDLLAAEAKRG